MKSYSPKTRSAIATIEEEILFSGPRSGTPTQIHLRVFEVPGGPSVAILSESKKNRGLPLEAVEDGIAEMDRHAVPSNLTGLAAVAQEYCRSFWEGFVVLLEIPSEDSRSGGTRFVVRYSVGNREFPDALSGSEVEALIAPDCP